MTSINHCIIIHPQRNMKDFLRYTGIVRKYSAENDGKVIYFLKKQFEIVIKQHFSDLEMQYELVDELDDKHIFKTLLSIYKNLKIRYMFGIYDKYRFDSYKNKSNSSNDIDPYSLYDISPSVEYEHFKVNIQDNSEAILKTIRSVANMDFQILSNIEDIPIQYKKNSSINIILNRMFTETKNFFDALTIISKCKTICMNDYNVYTYLLTLLDKSNQEYLKKNAKVLVFHKNDELFIEYVPDSWKKIKIFEEE